MSLPTKKQRELLDFITTFIGEYGYSPSYREIKSAMSYGSVATVAKHIENLVTKGLLEKRHNSARSLEPTSPLQQVPQQLRPKTSANERWLIDAIEAHFRSVESAKKPTQLQIDHLTVLVASLHVLGLDGAFTAFSARLRQLSKK